MLRIKGRQLQAVGLLLSSSALKLALPEPSVSSFTSFSQRGILPYPKVGIIFLNLVSVSFLFIEMRKFKRSVLFTNF